MWHQNDRKHLETQSFRLRVDGSDYLKKSGGFIDISGT